MCERGKLCVWGEGAMCGSAECVGGAWGGGVWYGGVWWWCVCVCGGGGGGVESCMERVAWESYGRELKNWIFFEKRKCCQCDSNYNLIILKKSFINIIMMFLRFHDFSLPLPF